jgi:hypothetical protein
VCGYTAVKDSGCDYYVHSPKEENLHSGSAMMRLGLLLGQTGASPAWLRDRKDEA